MNVQTAAFDCLVQPTLISFDFCFDPLLGRGEVDRDLLLLAAPSQPLLVIGGRELLAIGYPVNCSG